MSDTTVDERPPATRRGRAGDPRPGKVAAVDEVRGKLAAAGAAILTEYRGLTVHELERLRRSLRQAGGEYKIYKNTLVRFATRDLGVDLDALLVGPTAIAFADADVPAVAKALREFSRGNPLLVVKGGVMGTSVLTAGDATALADIPSREVLLAQLAGMMAAPLQQFAGLLQALPRNLAYGLKALIDAGGAAGAPASVPEAAAPAAEAEAEPAVTSAEPAAEPEAAATAAEPAAAEPAATQPEAAATAAEPEPEPTATAAEPEPEAAATAAEPEPEPTATAAEPEPEAAATAAEPAAAEPEPAAAVAEATDTEPTTTTAPTPAEPATNDEGSN